MVLSRLFPSTKDKWQPIAKQLESIVGKDGVIRRKEELLTYECDGLASYRQRPALVVLPRTTEAEAAALKYARQLRQDKSLKVELELGDRSKQAIEQYARTCRIDKLIWIEADGSSRVEILNRSE